MVSSRLCRTFVQRCATFNNVFFTKLPNANSSIHVRCLSGYSPPRERSYYMEPLPNGEPLHHVTYYSGLKHALNTNANKVGWIFAGENHRHITIDEFYKDVVSLATGFLNIGIKRGDRVLLWMPNFYDFVAVQAGLATIGAISASVHPAYTPHELATAMNTIKCKAIVTMEGIGPLKFYETLKTLIPELENSAPGKLNSSKFPFLESIVVNTEKALPGCIALKDLRSSPGNKDDIAKVAQQVSAFDPLTIIFTSGTTGAAKAAILTHHGFLNNGIGLNQRSEFEATLLCDPLPLFHAFGMMGCLGHPIISSATVIVPSFTYNVPAMIDAIEKYKCTELWGSPTMFLDMMSKPEFNSNRVKTLTHLTLGGNMCTTAVRQLIAKKFNNCCILVGYGMTECTTSATFSSSQDPLEKQMTTCGRPAPYVEVSIMNPDGQCETKIGEVGEIWVRGYNLFAGYYGEPEKTAQVMTKTGWYKSGDLGVMDKDGYVTVVGRLKDLIIRGGENIHPSEIEEVLEQHPCVGEVHVVGVPDSRMGEEVCAWIVPRPGVPTATNEELQAYCKDKITYFKIPRYFIFDANIPRTAIGKAQKMLLRNQAAQKLNLK